MKWIYDGRYWLVFVDGIQHEVEKDLWEKLKKLKELEGKL